MNNEDNKSLHEMKLSYKILWGVLVSLILTGCSVDESGQDNPVADNNGTNSSVEIKLTLGQVEMVQASIMRSSIESDDNSNFVIDGTNGNYLGVFCLAYDWRNGETSDVDWISSDMSRPMQNVQATVKKEYSGKMIDDGNGGKKAEVVSNIQWNNSYYYPMGGCYKFRFYGYYPRVGDEQVTIGSNTVTANLTLTGHDDVVYGSTRTSESGDAYCAEYFYDNNGTLPSLKLNHALARICFRAYGNATYSAASRIQVTEIKLHNMPTDYILTLADRDNIVNEGKMTRNGNNMVDVVLNDEEGSNGLTRTYTIKGTHTSSNPLRIGHEILVPEDAAYYITVTMKKGNGNDCSPTGYWKLEPEGGFKAGKTYWVDLIISNNPEEASGGVLTID